MCVRVKLNTYCSYGEIRPKNVCSMTAQNTILCCKFKIQKAHFCGRVFVSESLPPLEGGGQREARSSEGGRGYGGIKGRGEEIIEGRT